MRTVFSGAGNECGSEAGFPRGSEVVVVRCGQHQLARLNSQNRSSSQIRFGTRLVLASDVRPDNDVPRKPAPLRHPHQQRSVAVGQRPDDESRLQHLETRAAVRPWRKAFPRFVQRFNLGRWNREVELFECRDEVLTVQLVKWGERPQPVADRLHGRLISAAPGVSESVRVEVKSEAFDGTLDRLANSPAPVDNRPECVEHDRSNDLLRRRRPELFVKHQCRSLDLAPTW